MMRMTQRHRRYGEYSSLSITTWMTKKVAVLSSIITAVSTTPNSCCFSSVAFTPTSASAPAPAFFISAHSYSPSHPRNDDINNVPRVGRRHQYSTSTIATAAGSSNQIRRRDSSRCMPFTWDELVQIVQSDDESSLSLLCRDPKVEEMYEKHRREVDDEWISIYDFLLWSKFGFDRIKVNNNNDDEGKTSDNTKWQSSPRIDELSISGIVHKVLVQNEFPYYVDPNNILHYVLWKTCEPINDDDIIDAKRELLLKLELEPEQDLAAATSTAAAAKEPMFRRLVEEEEKEEDILLHWINPLHLQSLPDINHAHFLLRRTIDFGGDNKENNNSKSNKNQQEEL